MGWLPGIALVVYGAVIVSGGLAYFLTWYKLAGDPEILQAKYLDKPEWVITLASFNSVVSAFRYNQGRIERKLIFIKFAFGAFATQAVVVAALLIVELNTPVS